MNLQAIGSGRSFLDSVELTLRLLNRQAGFQARNHEKVKLAVVRDQLAGGGYEWFEDFVTIRRSMSCLPRHDGQHRKTKRLWHYADNSVLIGSNSNGAADHRCTAVKKTLPRTPRQNDDI